MVQFYHRAVRYPPINNAKYDHCTTLRESHLLSFFPFKASDYVIYARLTAQMQCLYEHVPRER